MKVVGTFINSLPLSGQKILLKTMGAIEVLKKNIEDDNYLCFTDMRDNLEYKTVCVGNQVWFAENFKHIPKVSSPEIQSGIWAYDYYGSSVNEAKLTENYIKYGCLYNLEMAKTLTPAGWHLPTEDDWDELLLYIHNNENFFC